MKPITISAMVAGVQAGRINAELVIVTRSLSVLGSRGWLHEFEVGTACPRFKNDPIEIGYHTEK
jgi:hypothetical protein